MKSIACKQIDLEDGDDRLTDGFVVVGPSGPMNKPLGVLVVFADDPDDIEGEPAILLTPEDARAMALELVKVAASIDGDPAIIPLSSRVTSVRHSTLD